MSIPKILVTLLIAAFATLASAASTETATTLRAIDLKARAATDATTVIAVPAKTTANVVERKGAWVHVRVGKSEGWAKLSDLRMNKTAKAAGANGQSEADRQVNLASGDRDPSVATAVSGIDGNGPPPNARDYDRANGRSAKDTSVPSGKGGALDAVVKGLFK